MIKKVSIDWESNIGEWYRRKEINEFLHTPYVNKLLRYILQEYYTTTIYPDKKSIFKSFQTCNPDNLRVVIIGGEPYSDGSATGLAFANREDKVRLSDSLETIRECIERTVYNGYKLTFDPTLENWSKQGVMLLNTALTTPKEIYNSHKNPWRKFIQFFIKYITQYFPGTIFLLWGKEAQSYEIIDGVNISDYCHVLKAEHPSFSAFENVKWDCNHFNEVNDIIFKQNGRGYDIKW